MIFEKQFGTNLTQENIEVEYLGRVSFETSLAYQREVHKQVAGKKRHGVLLVTEHPETISFGLHSKQANLLRPLSTLKEQGVAVVQCERGGEVTAHMPGQIVIYPILPLDRLPFGVRGFVNWLEQSVIDTLAHWDVKGLRRAGYPGIWVQSHKICALGLRFQQRTSFHGLAFNVCANLELFSYIIPCGIKGCLPINLRDCVQICPSLENVKRKLVEILCSNLIKQGRKTTPDTV